MDLIFTNAKRVDLGALSAYAFDLSFGASENDFEITVGTDEANLEFGSVVYMEGTEYGGMVSTVKTSTGGDNVTYKGKTWHGILNNKVIQPDTGEDYLVVSGDGNEVLATLIARLGLGGLFVAVEESAGVNISNYQFNRYCKGYDGIRAMLAANKAKLKVEWKNRSVYLSAVPIADYTNLPVDGDIATLSLERNEQKVNHLICLGQGELAEREVLHLYVDQFGKIGDVQYYTGLDEVTEVYEYTVVESSDELRSGGVERLNELRNIDTAEIIINEDEDLTYDIGDIVGASDLKSGITVAASVTQKIVKINNGVVSTEYKTGG